MSLITWKQFKEQVEAAGVTDDMQILYIDIQLARGVEVRLRETGDNTFFVLKDYDA